MRTRGLTIIELLIAIAILLAMTAIALPNLLGRLDRRAFDGATDTVRHHLVLARAEAMREGRAVEVVVRHAADATPDVPQVMLIARYFAPGLDVADDGAAVFDPDGSTDELNVDDFDDVETTSIMTSWAMRQLPEGILVVDAIPTDLLPPEPDDFGGMDDVAEDFEALDLDAGFDDTLTMFEQLLETIDIERDTRLVVFLPDGSALLSEPIYLLDSDNRRATVTVNPWSGQPTVHEAEAVVATSPEDDDEEFDEDDEAIDDEAIGDDDASVDDDAGDETDETNHDGRDWS